jgi:hypothetical protein
MRVLELFSGTATFARVARERGHEALTVDYDEACGADLNVDFTDGLAVFSLLERVEEFDPHCLWASPPCEAWSVAAFGHHWGGGRRAYEPKTEAAKQAMLMVEILRDFIAALDPPVWYVENPVGMMRKVARYDQIPGYFTRQTITYCQYGDDPGESGLPRMKPTDIWTNNHFWVPRPRCSNGDPCHERAPRGAKTGTQGRSTYLERSRLPEELCVEVLEAAEMAGRPA